ncbi:VOC family protein [Hankyongella ginsenosidimutans]|uniref:VOC family protein n=1 Tax=Hankyongella ginsenosidimutans TaxID=1763828 RepID=UPI00319E06AB
MRASQWFYLYVDDVDDVMARAVAAGATVESPAEDALWGDRMGIIVCPNGYRWSVARWRGAADS